MGRLNHWMERAARACRRRGRTARSATSRRRPLAFERYEPRIALSAATQTDWTDAYGQPVMIWRSYDGIQSGVHVFAVDELGQSVVNYDLDDLITITPSIDFSQWLDSYSGVVSPWNSPLLSQHALNAPAIGEGGLIGLDAYVDSDVSADLTLYGSSLSLIDNAFDGDAAGGAVSSFLTFFKTARQFVGTSGGEGLAVANWQVVPDSAFNSLDAAGTQETFATTGSDDRGGFLRIVIVAPKSDDEGGSIDLAAMLGPINSAAPGASVQLAAATRTPAGVVPATYAVAEGDSLRARAVVYNVALVDESAAIAADRATVLHPSAGAHDGDQPLGVERTGRIRAAAPRPEPAERRATRVDPAQTPVGAEQASVDRRVDATPADVEQSRAAPAADETAKTSAPVYDAAFGVWDDELAELDAKAAIPLASTRERTLVGLAAAAVVGAPILARRTRRSKGAALIEKSAGLP